MPGLRDVDFECVDRGLKFLDEGKPYGQVDLMAGLRIIKDGEVFWLASGQNDLPRSDFPSIKPGLQLTLSISSTLMLNDDWKFQAIEVLDSKLAFQESIANLDPFQAWMDAGEFELPLIVRSRKAGECIRPIGMNRHSMKVSDLMINLKMPQRARSTWPLICSGEEILWIPGYRLSHLAMIKPSSHHIIHLTLSRSSTS
jgi:tRNA(Ile)-lysidine synthase